MKKLYLATYWERFLAWLIDFIVVMAIVGIIFRFDFYLFRLDKFIIFSSAFLLYWTILEYINGQSIGKKILNIKVVSLDNKKISIEQSAIQSFGKAFLLPIDFIIGVLARPAERSRLFNIISETAVIKIIEKTRKWTFFKKPLTL